jgi:hypothetical protein
MPNPTTGLTSAPRLVESASNVLHSLTQYRAFPASGLSSALTYSPAVLSAYVQQSTRRYIALRLRADSGGANGATMVFDTQTGAITYQANDGTGASRTVGFEAAGGAWWRVWLAVSGITPSAGWEGAAIVCNASTVPAAYLGDGASGVFATGLQLEPGTVPSEYLETTGVSIDDRFTVAGSYLFEITAANRLGTARRQFAQQVSPATPPSLGTVPTFTTGSTLGTGTAGSVYSATIAATGTPTPTYALAFSNASGAAVNASTGVLATSALAAGTYTATVTATNAAGSVSKTFTWSVANAIADPVAKRFWVGPDGGGVSWKKSR